MPKRQEQKCVIGFCLETSHWPRIKPSVAPDCDKQRRVSVLDQLPYLLFVVSLRCHFLVSLSAHPNNGCRATWFRPSTGDGHGAARHAGGARATEIVAQLIK